MAVGMACVVGYSNLPGSRWTPSRQRIRYAGFPAIRTITDFDFTAQPALDRAQISRLGAGGWLAEARSIVLLGPLQRSGIDTNAAGNRDYRFLSLGLPGHRCT
jgi:hypothetical protein